MKNDYKIAKAHETCSGCSCCLLSCPVWRKTRDRSMTAQGRNKALQGGATVEDIAEAIDACILCGACEPNCHEGNDIVGLTLEQRRLLNQVRSLRPSWYPDSSKPYKSDGIRLPYKGTVLLAGEMDNDKVGAIHKVLGNGLISAADAGRDIARLLEAGLPVNQSRLDDFLYPLRTANTVVASDALLLHLNELLPGKKVLGLGEALLAVDAVRRSLSPDDLYIIEARWYHHNYARLVRFYDRVHKETGVQFNLDLQRAAIPTGASSLQGQDDLEKAGCIEQARWILQGKKVKRIIVEDMADIEVFRRVTEVPVVHVALVE